MSDELKHLHMLELALTSPNYVERTQVITNTYHE